MQTIQEVARENLERFAKQLQEPPVPLMSQEEWDNLPQSRKIFLCCNVIGCGRVVCTHGGLCLEHHTGIDEIEQYNKDKDAPKTYVRLSCDCANPKEVYRIPVFRKMDIPENRQEWPEIKADVVVDLGIIKK